MRRSTVEVGGRRETNTVVLGVTTDKHLGMHSHYVLCIVEQRVNCVCVCVCVQCVHTPIAFFTLRR